MGHGRVLLTGGAGVLGRHLVESAPHLDVVALCHRRTVAGVASVTADLREAAGVAAAVASVEPALIVHAAYAIDRASIVDATRHLVDAARAVGARVLYVSSDAVFRGDGLPRDEQSPPDATWDYGRWKTEAEQIVADATEDGAIVRLPLLVSIDPDDHAVQKIRAGAAGATPTRWFTDEMRQPAYASEVAEAIWRIAALAADARRGCWHLAGAERLSRFEVARRMVDRLHLPDSAIEPSTQPAGSDRPRDIAFSDARARSVVGWNPSPIA